MNHEEPEAIVICHSCGEVLPLVQAAFDGKAYRHVWCHHKWEKAVDNARDYKAELEQCRREKECE